jgi:hypothetical protein
MEILEQIEKLACEWGITFLRNPTYLLVGEAKAELLLNELNDRIPPRDLDPNTWYTPLRSIDGVVINLSIGQVTVIVTKKEDRLILI